MNKRIVMCAVLYFLLATQSSYCGIFPVYAKKNRVHKNEALRKFCSSYMASLLLSGCVGAATGTITRYIEKQFDIESSQIALFWYIVSWTLESEIRNDILIGLQGDLDGYQVEYRRGLMFKGAWISSWLAYLQL